MVLSRKRRQKLRAELLKANETNPETLKPAIVEGNNNNITEIKKKKNKRKRNPEVVQNNGEKVDELKVFEQKVETLKKQKLNEEPKMVSLNGGDDKLKQKPPKKKKKKKKMKKKKSKKMESEVFDELVNKEIEVENQVAYEQIVSEISTGNDGDVKKVYVGGMPYYTTEDDIRSYFVECGVITDIDCMYFPETGKFRGIAILNFETEEGAENALALDGSDMGGLYLNIQPYKATRPTKTSTFSPPVIEGYNRIYAGNLSWDITEDGLRKLFSDCKISTIRFGEDKATGDFKGYAHVDFADDASLNKALKLDQKFVCGRPVKISRAVPKKGVVTNGTPASTAVKPPNSAQINAVVTPENTVSINSVETPVNNERVEEVVPPPQPESKSVVSSGKLKRRTCYDCGERGHISSDCPKKQNS